MVPARRTSRRDPVFDEFVWLAPPLSAGAWVALVAVAAGLDRAVHEGLVAGLGTSAGLMLLGLLGSLPVIAVNMVLAYGPSAVAWHLARRVARAWLGERVAVRVAGACAALVASLILLGAILAVVPPGLDGATILAGLAIVPVSVAVSVHAAADALARESARHSRPGNAA